jgi:Fic family protein
MEFFNEMIKYTIPDAWMKYDVLKIVAELTDAKASVKSLKSVPFQRSWADALQEMQLKREVAGTSRIEGADFTERELDAAMMESPEQLRTRSQRQAAAAVSTYRWIAKLPDDQPINGDLIREVHRRIVTGADDDHCTPGKLRCRDENVTFGIPKHRGAEGGDECDSAFEGLGAAIQKEFPKHDPLIQALALHYHFAAMHPFMDGNGRTARALEALVLQRSGLRETLFIAMSNYYYDEKTRYLSSLSEVRSQNHDLTAFLIFSLQGIAVQCGRLFDEIKAHLSKALFKNTAMTLFGRLKTKKKRVIAQRQLVVLDYLMNVNEMDLNELGDKTESSYQELDNPHKMFLRDLNNLIRLKAIKYRLLEDKDKEKQYKFSVRLEWPCEITETDFFAAVKKMPKAKTMQHFS